MIPVIDLEAPDALDRIDEAYSTVGFAVFTNALPSDDKVDMSAWQEQMKSFFDLPLETKQQYPYEGDTNLGYSMIGDENVDPTAPKDIKESFKTNHHVMFAVYFTVYFTYENKKTKLFCCFAPSDLPAKFSPIPNL